MVVLGVDAAWTTHRASGVAVVAGEPGAWRCLAAVSSYEEFFQLARRRGLVAATEAIAGAPPDVAAIDMPLARTPIVARRVCDNLLTSAFARYGCGVHSSTPERPGRVSAELLQEFELAGYELAVFGTHRRVRQVIEVYPHVAVMRLLGADYRVPYKLGRMSKYWPDAAPAERRKRVRANLGRILRALREQVDDLRLRVPGATAGPAELKRFEDALDGVVCAWIGTRYLEDPRPRLRGWNAAIWTPE